MQKRVAVVGAGVAGLSAAKTLQENGHCVTVFDKARGPGGRTSVRRGEGGHAFDHGAQYFTVSDPRFDKEVKRWMEAGLVKAWETDGRLVSLNEDGVKKTGEGDDGKKTRMARYVGVPGMNALCKAMASDLDLKKTTRVIEIQVNSSSGFSLRAEPAGDNQKEDDPACQLGSFDQVVLAMPPQQAAELCQPVAPALAKQAEAVEMLPCWVVMLGFEKPLPLDYDGAFVNKGQLLSWIARDSSKPGRKAGLESWVLHAAPTWSAANWFDYGEKQRIIDAMVSAFAEVTGLKGDLPKPTLVDTHRWRYALAKDGGLKEEGYLAADTTGGCAGLVLAGDWAAGSRVEGAYVSGVAAANYLMGRNPSAAPVDNAAASQREGSKI